MLTEKQFDDYINELHSRHRAAQIQLEQAKANLNAVEGMLQAAAELKALNSKKPESKEAK